MTAQSEQPIRVLIVDDNRDAATSLGLLLTLVGFEVQTCFDGHSAVEKSEQFHPDACVLDINMPGMDGYEVARRVRNGRDDQMPVLATVTAYADDAHLDRASDAGFDLHFTKPANGYDVAEQLTECVRRERTAPALR